MLTAKKAGAVPPGGENNQIFPSRELLSFRIPLLNGYLFLPIQMILNQEERNIMPSRSPDSQVEDEFLIDLYGKDNAVHMEIEWNQSGDQPEKIVLKFEPSELRQLILKLEEQLTPRDAA